MDGLSIESIGGSGQDGGDGGSGCKGKLISNNSSSGITAPKYEGAGDGGDPGLGGFGGDPGKITIRYFSLNEEAVIADANLSVTAKYGAAGKPGA